jgi:putative transposase
MIDRDHALPLAHQAQLLELSRGSLYYVPVPVSQADLDVMREIDKLHLDIRSPAPGCCAACCDRRAVASVVGTSAG